VAGEDDGHATISRQGGWSFLSFRSRTRPVQFTTAFVSILAGVYFALLLLRCLQLGWIFRRTLHLRRLAHERTAPAALACAAETCQRLFAIPAVPLLCSEEVASPSTLGWRRPVLLVPANLFTDQIGEEDAISALGHEMAHIQRRDFGLNLLYEVVSVPLWFHPATTLIKARIAQTRELACDEMAARLLPSGKQYARSLLHMAQNMFAAAPSAKSNYAMGLFDTHALEERIMNILRVPRGGKRASRTRMGIAVALLGAVSLLCSAFSLRVAPDTASVDIHRFVGTWVTKHKGQTFITIKLKSENGKLGGTCTHVDRVDYVDGELIPSSDQYVEQEIVEAKVSGNKVDLRIGGHDSIYVEFTLKGTNDADVITVADSPDAGDSQDQGPPQKKPWHFERVADGR
jgi:beta-lactamase regulating signal transducer with metallopeptidase domain